MSKIIREGLTIVTGVPVANPKNPQVGISLGHTFSSIDNKIGQVVHEKEELDGSTATAQWHSPG